jgi:hypothetical protein
MAAEETKEKKLEALIQEIRAAALTAKEAVLEQGGSHPTNIGYVQKVQFLVSNFLTLQGVSLYDIVHHLTELVRGIDEGAAEPIIMSIMVESRKLGLMEGMYKHNSQGKVN